MMPKSLSVFETTLTQENFNTQHIDNALSMVCIQPIENL